MTREEHIRELMAEYAARRGRDRAEADERLRELVARDPQVGVLRARSARLVTDAMRAFMEMQDADRRREIAEKMRADGLENNRAMRERLRALNLSEDYLDESYRCPICRDTGYTDEIPAKFCACFERALRLRQFEDGTMAGIEEQNFRTFDAELVRRANPEPEIAEKILGARVYCEGYADKFPHNERENIVFTGPGGVGKTFLLNAVFARVVERGHSGIRVTAYRMLEAMRKKHMGSEADAESFEAMIAAPILLIDDLGTEPMLKNVTVEYLFTLLNERCAQRLHTVVATNLSPAQIKERYGERVSSRLLDTSRCALITMRGKDLRIK
jgi:DNA replication protein DnaC